MITGTLHLAFFCRTRTIALFKKYSPDQYCFHNDTISINNHVYCSPCVHGFVTPHCIGNNVCMIFIAVETVINAIANYEVVLAHEKTQMLDHKLAKIITMLFLVHLQEENKLSSKENYKLSDH
jgi:hypothetical protein